MQRVTRRSWWSGRIKRTAPGKSRPATVPIEYIYPTTEIPPLHPTRDRRAADKLSLAVPPALEGHRRRRADGSRTHRRPDGRAHMDRLRRQARCAQRPPGCLDIVVDGVNLTVRAPRSSTSALAAGRRSRDWPMLPAFSRTTSFAGSPSTAPREVGSGPRWETGPSVGACGPGSGPVRPDASVRAASARVEPAASLTYWHGSPGEPCAISLFSPADACSGSPARYARAGDESATPRGTRRLSRRPYPLKPLAAPSHQALSTNRG